MDTDMISNECKRRKLKCIRHGDSVTCARCADSDAPCSFRAERQGDENGSTEESRVDRIERDLGALRQEVTRLSRLLVERHPPEIQAGMGASHDTPSHVSAPPTGLKEHKEPHFVGTTRPAFGLNVAKEALAANDEAYEDSSDEESEIISGSASPHVERPAHGGPHDHALDPLFKLSSSEVSRLLLIFEDEVESVYPILETSKLRDQATSMIDHFREEVHLKFDGRASQKDIHLLKVVLAAALAVDSHGKNDLGCQLIGSFEDDALRITSPSDVDLQEAQIFAIMSIYHFYCDEELMAYRSIGISGRMVLELGLHRRRSLEENYPDPQQREVAVTIFWCIYALDRRWSFGAGLSFVLIDKDIDPRVPEPPSQKTYFRCLVGFSKLSSRVWEALPQYGSSSEIIPAATAARLDQDILEWSSGIPGELSLSSPIEDSLRTRNGQDERLQKLRALLYLRGNYVRSLVHRHHVLSSRAIAEDPAQARLVVDIATDTIQVLVTLHEHATDIYMRTQVGWNFFLVSAISIVLLAVCHAPAVFAEICRKDYFSAIDLVRGSSKSTLQSRRLWSNLRGLVSRLKRFGLQRNKTETRRTTRRSRSARSVSNDHAGRGFEDGAAPQLLQTPGNDLSVLGEWPIPEYHADLDFNLQDMNRMGDDLLGVFDAIGHGYMGIPNGSGLAAPTGYYGALTFDQDAGDDASCNFMGLM